MELLANRDAAGLQWAGKQCQGSDAGSQRVGGADGVDLASHRGGGCVGVGLAWPKRSCNFRASRGSRSRQPFELRDAVVAQLGPLQQRLAKLYPSSFGGLWVDDSGLTTVAIVGDSAVISAELGRAGFVGPVSYISATYSEQEIRDAHLAFRNLIDPNAFAYDGMPLAAVSEDIPGNRVVVAVVGNAAKIDAIRATNAKDSIVQFISVGVPSTPAACTQTNCGNPMKAGLQLFNSGGSSSCMSNFTWRTKSTPFAYYIGSAGHCHSVGVGIYHPVGTWIGNVTFSTAGPSAIVDASLTTISAANASNKILNYRMQVYNIVTEETIASAVIGEGVCSSRKSGTSCGHLVSKAVDTCCARGEFSADGQNFASGDSGSPVHYGAKAQGIASAMQCGGTTIDCYSPVQSVEIWKNYLVMLTN